MALYHILHGTPNLTIILPTAGGKSTLFLLAASLSMARTSVIITPLVSLKEGLYARAHEYGVPCAIWEEALSATHPQPLILASIETIDRHPNFIGFCQRLAAQGQLDRIIFDEAHIIPGQRHFREVMNHVRAMGLIRTQKIYITATLSEHTATGLQEIFSLPPHQLTIRANINQPNIAYSVRLLASWRTADHFDEMVRFYRDFDPAQPPQPILPAGSNSSNSGGSSGGSGGGGGGNGSGSGQDHGMMAIRDSAISSSGPGLPHTPVKAIIYFQNKKVLEAFYEAYQDLVACYHSDLTNEDKQSQLHAFLQSEKSILAATGAISAGFDFPDVNLVIHYLSAWGFTDFVQESGRLSRRPGQVGHSVIFMQPTEATPRATDSLERQLIREYLTVQQCRRGMIHRIFNGEIQPFCLPSERACDLCHGRGLVLDQGPTQVTLYNQQTAQRCRRLHALYQRLQTSCLPCWFFQDPHNQDLEIQPRSTQHAIATCPYHRQYQQYHHQFVQQVRRRTPPKDSCHFPCLLPTRLCHQFHETGPSCAHTVRFLLYWGALLYGFESYHILLTKLQPHEAIFTWEAFLQWFYQVDYVYFGTEALYGVLAFYHWAKMRIISSK
ncbi:MAG TPA: helicase-related protein [Candidatus Angelobacter sp.]|nr:helicase-related protein [Candidatus Angelobacter sp.]